MDWNSREQDQVEPAVVAEPDAPDEVAVALLELPADEAGGQGGQRLEVEGAAPASGGEAVEQVADHARAREQELVGGVRAFVLLVPSRVHTRGVRGVRVLGGSRGRPRGRQALDEVLHGARTGPSAERPESQGNGPWRAPTGGGIATLGRRGGGADV